MFKHVNQHLGTVIQNVFMGITGGCKGLKSWLELLEISVPPPPSRSDWFFTFSPFKVSSFEVLTSLLFQVLPNKPSSHLAGSLHSFL